MNEKIHNFWQGFWYDPKGRAKLGNLFADRLFWIVLVFKLIAGAMFASDYLAKLFIPFIEHFAANPLDNPYAYFMREGQPQAFPYPAFMLYVMALPRMAVGLFFSGELPVFLQLFLYRLPLLLADLAILMVLARWLRGKTHRIVLLYWASPVLFYVTYLHGQLDAIPLAMLFVALYAMFNEKPLRAAVAFGLGLAAKTHLAITLPFFLLYLWRRDGRIGPLAAFTAVVALAFLLPNLPWIGSADFLTMVFHNAEQRKVTLAAVSFSGGAEYYIVLGAYILLLFNALQITVQNRDLFLMFLGFSFGALLLFIAPMPGWYFWLVPFFAYFFARASERQALLLGLLQVGYLLYFALKPESDYRAIFQFLDPDWAQGETPYQLLGDLGFDAAIPANAAYTLMQTALLANCAWIYWRGVQGYQKHKLTARSFLLGVSGDSGSGKTTLAQAMEDLFTPRNTAVVCGDDMHKWQRGHAKWKELTHLDPRANELHQELDYIMALRQRQAIHRRHYDHATGSFTDDIVIKPKPLVVLEGLHSFYLKPARQLMDLKIFVKPDDSLLVHRKVLRDMQARGHSKEQVLEDIRNRREDSEKYIKVQERSADIVVAFKVPELVDVGGAATEPVWWLQLVIGNAFYLDPLAADFAEIMQKDFRHYYDTEENQVLEFRAAVAPEILERLGEKHAEGLHDLGVYVPQWRAGMTGLLQLVIAYCIFHDSRRANV